MPEFLYPIILVAAFGIIVLIVILLKKHVKVFKKDEQPKSDKEIAAEELDRLLEPVEELEPKPSEETEDSKAEESGNDDLPKA